MFTVFQNIFLYIALAGLALLLTILIVKSKTILLLQSRLLNYWRSLSPFGRIAVMSFLTASILYGGSKTNSPPRLTMMRPTSSTKISYAERKAQNWNIRGAWKDSCWLNFADGWRFPYGTNHLRGVEVISYGELWQTPFDNNAVASIGVPAEIVPTLSSFSYEYTPSNSYRFVWENAAINRDTKNLISASLELFRNGDAFIVTNGVATYKERVLPSEWGDPSEDGFYGNDNLLPAGADLNAYYWVDLVVSNATAKVLFTGDKPSNYPDPEFIAKYNETNRVFLLIGKKYTATSDETITVVSKSSDDIIIDYISSKEIDIVLPVEFLVTNENEIDKTTSRAVTQVPTAGGFKIMPFPFLKGYYVWNTNVACCITHSNKVNDVWIFSCNKECNCTGCSFNGTFHYEGYYLDVFDVSCGCSSVEEPSATASISFSKSAVIFENCYTNAPNDIVPRRSTTNSLDITIYGGPFGGSAEIEFDDKEKLEYLTQEVIPRAVSVAAEQTLELSFPFIAKEESASENDIKASLKFTEYFTGDVIESEDEMTAVRVEITPVVLRDGADHRHLLGVGERVLCEMHPWVSGLSFECESNGNIELHHKYAYYMSPLKSECSHLDVTVDGSTCFQILCDIIEPEEIIATQCEEIVMVAPTNTAGAVGMKLDLFVKPMTVSFRGISMMENAVTNGAPGEGFFSNEVFRDIWFHNRNQGAGVFYAISNDNFFFSDEAKFAIAIEPPWGLGRITWQIPISWAAREAQHENEIVGVLPICYTQEFEIFQSGSFRLTKHGYWVERHADGSRSRSQGVLYQ